MFAIEDRDTRVITLWHEVVEIVETHPPLARIEFNGSVAQYQLTFA
jgi:hypothetical protein